MSSAGVWIDNANIDRSTVGFKDIERWITVATAAALLTYSLRHRSIAGLAAAVAATPLAFRGLAGRWPRSFADETETRRALGGDRGIHVRESVRIEKPLAEVYRFWRQFGNLPLFMLNLERVTELDEKRSHWIAKGPAGILVEWDAEIINEVENKVIGWQSLPESDVVTAGSVNFDAVRQGSETQISVHLQYAPPAGKLGAAVATIVGREPSQTIREDLRRLKQLLEAGEIPRTASTFEAGSRS
jgi:uncharacterized membrane protein